MKWLSDDYRKAALTSDDVGASNNWRPRATAVTELLEFLRSAASSGGLLAVPLALAGGVVSAPGPSLSASATSYAPWF